ncbi:DUF4190 domain-containing protein [Leucobacter ruminantium]|uniref:DUF4190 domain-containing protein n=1 Tax=Leucobacter ruminantium TaxID=1289170 RepID=A0A939LTL5_9MICO|nr:DUF4190 domain-containing protein [Leucobacter ruminantium]MBO1804162.1 DUF4190 domain-containing protein [Leucobacter ruminantium]
MSNTAPQHQAGPAQPTQPLPPYTAPTQPYQAAQPGYAPAQASPAPAPAGTKVSDTNTFALLSIILAFIAPLAAIIFGHMGLSQIKRTGDAGRGIALTGTIIGYAYFVAIGLFIIFYIGMLVMVFGTMGAAFSSMDSFGSGDYSYDDYSYDY